LIVELFGVGGNAQERGGEHGQGDVPVPGVVAAKLVVVQAGLVLGELGWVGRGEVPAGQVLFRAASRRTRYEEFLITEANSQAFREEWFE
jgi:hypothetical protein